MSEKFETPVNSTLPPKEERKALLVTAPRGDISKELAQDHLDELELLVETYGLPVAGKVICHLRKFAAATLVTPGKLEELIETARQVAADVIIFDDEISPAQQRNLEKAFGAPVMDRTEIILEVFSQRAQSREARLQVELAKVKYQIPRLKRLWTHLERQAGTGAGGQGAYTKGAGEKQIEIDRRLLRKRIDRLQDELLEADAHRETVRVGRQRSAIPICGLVGYTNAGKSTLMNALTEAGVFVEDKLFATLDTTTRKFMLRNKQEILLIDTVGFIRKLPHNLVAAFRSTLQEAAFADILLHVVDVSNHAAVEQAVTTIEVLKELGAGDRPIITLLNKIDLPNTAAMATRLRTLYPKTIPISALTGAGLEEIEERIIEELQSRRRRVKLRIPQSDYGVITELMRVGNIIDQEYEDNDVMVDVELPPDWAERLSRYHVNT